MKSTELRIGNLVKGNSRGGTHVLDIGILKYIDETECGYSPIALTDEWLVKLGAKKFNHAFLYDRFRLIPRPEYGFYQVVDKETNVYITKVEFVHEWQNVVFVLNGQELILKTEL